MNTRYIWLVAAAFGLAVVGLWARGKLGEPGPPEPSRVSRRPTMPSGPPPAGAQTATFGSGCFWCTEAVFQELNGVHSVVSGNSGGFVKNPTYREVCSGKTGHAEVVQIVFDPKVISFPELLAVFWQTHDPTTQDRQGNDRGPQYRSVIFYHDREQKDLANHYLAKLDAEGVFAAPIVTEIVPFKAFYPAERDHQNFYVDNPGHGYFAMIIRPKLEKFEKVFKDKLRKLEP